jgi:hypothetical protein
LDALLKIDNHSTVLSLTREGLKPRSIVYGLGLTINDKGGVGANTIQKRGKDVLLMAKDIPSMTREGLELTQFKREARMHCRRFLTHRQ